MAEVSQFENIVVRSTPDGAQVKMKDIARVELGAENYASSGSYNGRPAALMAIYQLNEANGIQIRQACAERLESSKPTSPRGWITGFRSTRPPSSPRRSTRWS